MKELPGAEELAKKDIAEWMDPKAPTQGTCWECGNPCPRPRLQENKCPDCRGEIPERTEHSGQKAEWETRLQEAETVREWMKKHGQGRY